ncbi:hypothetical protein STRCI_002167 [Streptomyces cinnabarinus]|uniref:Uncharacterized protein n=1 Tax=Streptomyces cinnabarinus TaxID=67287 RepID=A0ABY7K918_9ACTN|nr:hypothetical protein [Streptomyces cinnabarinus]WAZ21014.1 hypothetical protein STRCI_002167 [Streptomyces cinnabarinus]
MSRTAHHTPPRHRTAPPYWPYGVTGPCTAHSLPELRYTHRELARAEREGRRPRPMPVRRSFAAYTYPRTLGTLSAGPYERRARAALQSFRRAAVKDLAAVLPGMLQDASQALDHAPTRHRHRDLWEA